MIRFTVLGAVALTLAAGQSASAQNQSLEDKASDPTASLMSFQLQNFYSPNNHNSDEDRNVLQFRAAIPYQLGGTSNIARLTLPYFTSTPAGTSGFGDMTLFNLTTFDQPWGRYGVGLVALLPTGSSQLSAEKWALGPALGGVAQAPWGLWGLFNQNLFTVDGDGNKPDVNISTLQPILNVKLQNGWSVGNSEMTFVYDWDADEFTSLPLGVQVSKLVKTGGPPVQMILSYERNFYDEGMGPKDTIGLTAKLLLPK